MVKKRKLLDKILSGSKNIRFDEFTSLLEAFGFELDRMKGSHHVFTHPEIPELLSIQPKKNAQAKPYQISQFLKIIKKYDLKMKIDQSDDKDEA